MGKTPRKLIPDVPTVYHVMSETALPGAPLNDRERDILADLIRQKASIYFIEVLGYCIMEDHFQLVLRTRPEFALIDEEILNRYKRYYGEKRSLSSQKIPVYRQKWTSLSELMKEIKQHFTRGYNKRHFRTGAFWAKRFESRIVQEEDALINCLITVDLTPLKTGMVLHPEDYRWSSLGYHVQTGNRGEFLSLNLGTAPFYMAEYKERLRQYRKLIYEKGAIDKKGSSIIGDKILKKETRRNFKIPLTMGLKRRMQYFSHSGIIRFKNCHLNSIRALKYQCRSRELKKNKPTKWLCALLPFKRMHD